MRRFFTAAVGFLILTSMVAAGTLAPGAAVAAPSRQGDGDVRSFLKKVKEAKSPEDRAAAVKAVEDSEPKTAEDVKALTDELEGPLAPAAQRAIGRAKDPSAVPVLIEAAESRRKNLRSMKAQDFDSLSDQEKKDEINRRVSLSVLVETLAKHKDRRSVPTLKALLDDDGLRYEASTALSAMGDESINDELMRRMDKEKDINLAGIKAPRLKSIVNEIDSPGTSKEKRGRLIGQIKGSRDPEVNRALKTLALTHKNYDVRSAAGLALVNSIIADPTVGDRAFVMQWAGQKVQYEEQEDAKAWAVDAMRKTWSSQYVPILIEMLKSRSWLIRSYAATILGEKKIVEAVPYLEDVLRKDKEDSVRRAACASLRGLTGRQYFVEVYESDYWPGTPDLDQIKQGKDSFHKLIGKKRP